MTRKKLTVPVARTHKLANAIIEAILTDMQWGLNNSPTTKTDEWERLFGNQSIVVNLQKLVYALAALPDGLDAEFNKEMAEPEGERLSYEEMRVLLAWLAEGKETG